MKFVLVLLIFVSWSTGQEFVFPDRYEAMLSSTIRPQAFQSSARDSPISNVNNNAFGPIRAASPPSRWNDQANSVISKGVLRFALNMDDAVSVSRARYVPSSRENVVFSPLSVAGALALVLLGSAGRTFEEVSSILGFNAGVDISRNSEVVHQMFGILLDAVAGRSGTLAAQSYFASGIFVRDGYPIRPEFKAVSENVYKSEVINLDFANRGSNAQETINEWVRDRTHGKIPEILNEPPERDTNVIIASALYFKAEWNQHFFDGMTRRKNFTIAPGESVDVDMMYNGGEFPFFEDRQLKTKIIGLPYKGGEATMYVVLPNDKGIDALRKLEGRLDAETLESLVRNMRNQTCILGLPRMRLSSTLSLKEALQSLGLRSLFDPSTADLSILSPGSPGATPVPGRQQPGRPTPRPTLTTGNDFFTFPTRFNSGDESSQPKPFPEPGLRQNYFTYDDAVRGYRVQQWATGFSIGRLPRERSRRSLRFDKRSAKKNEGKNFADVPQRKKRQLRRINENFLNFMANQNPQPAYGLDNLRNYGNLINPGLYADEVLHRVEIDVTETGTEAAAVTAVTLSKDGSQQRFVADHPFLFFIRHEPTGLLLFWGSVIKPEPNYPN